MEVHAGPVGGGASFLLFLLVSLRCELTWASSLSLRLLSQMTCGQKWIQELFLLVHVCLSYSYNIGQKIWQIGLEGW